MNYKKMCVIMGACLILVSIAFATVFASTGITVIVNGKKVDFEDVTPQIIDGRTMLPVRAIAEALNCNVEWNGDTNTVIITNNKGAATDISNKDTAINGGNESIIYDGSGVATTYLSGGKLYNRTTIESFTITRVEKVAYSEDKLKINYEIIGISSGSNGKWCQFSLICYDKDGFNIGRKTVLISVTPNTKYKLTDYQYIPASTAKIEIGNYD